MDILLIKLILQGEKGFKLKNIIKTCLINQNLKKILAAINFFKNNSFFFKLSKNFLFGNISIKCINENFRKKIFECFFQNSLNYNEINLQILREIGKKSSKGILQQYLITKINLKNNYFHHLFIKLSDLGIIQKSFCKINIKSKIYNSFILTIRFCFLKTNYLHDIFNNNKFYKKNNEIIFVKRLIKIGVRQKNKFFLEKNLKYGILFLYKLPCKLNRKKIHRLWQKIRDRCKKAKIFNFEEFKQHVKTLFPVSKNQFIEEKKNTNSLNFFKILRKKKRNWEIVFFFCSSIDFLLHKTIKFYGRNGINSSFLLLKFRGQLNYKYISGILNIYHKFKDYKKILEQIGRQKILNYKEKNSTITKNLKKIRNTINFSLKKGVTKQVLNRRLNLLSWIKTNQILLKDLGRKIAFHENRGLKRIDSKVIKRIISDLINFKLLKIIKIHIQIDPNKNRRFEFIIENNYKDKHIEDIFFFFLNPLKFLKTKFKNYKKENLICNPIKNIYFYEIIKNMFLKNLLQTQFKEKIFIQKLNSFKNLKIFLLTKLLSGRNLDFNRYFFKNNSVFNFFFKVKEKSKKIKNQIKFRVKSLNFIMIYYFIAFKKKIFFFNFFDEFLYKKNWNILTIFKKKNKLKKFSFFYFKNFKKFRLKKFLKKRIDETFFLNLNYKKLFKFPLKLIIYQKNKKKKIEKVSNFHYLISKNLSNEKWDCEFDANLYTCFLFFKFQKKNNSFSNFLKKNFIFFKRRIKKIFDLSNIKMVNSIFYKIMSNKNSFFLNNERYNFRNLIKRSLEFPSTYFFFDIEKITLKHFFNRIDPQYFNPKEKKILKKNENKIFSEKINIYFLNLYFFKMVSDIRNIFVLYILSSFKIIYFLFLKKFFLLFENLNKKENFFNFETLKSFQFLTIFNKKKKEKFPIYLSEQLIFAFKFKEYNFFQKFDNQLIALVPFFVKAFFFSKFFISHLIIYKSSYVKNFWRKCVLNPIEIRIIFFSSLFLLIEECKKKCLTIKKYICKKNNLNSQLIKILIQDYQKKLQVQKKIIKKNFLKVFFIFPKRKVSNLFFYYWSFFPINNYFYEKFPNLNFLKKSIKINYLTHNFKFYEKLKYTIYFKVIKKVHFLKNDIFFLFKYFPNAVFFLEKCLKTLSLENRIQNKKLISKFIFSKSYFFLSSLYVESKISRNTINNIFITPRYFIN
jgi:hypothetical protein